LFKLGAVLIAARGLQPSGLSKNRATKSKSPLGRTRRSAPVWHWCCVIAYLCGI